MAGRVNRAGRIVPVRAAGLGRLQTETDRIGGPAGMACGGMGQGWARQTGQVRGGGAGEIWACESSRVGPDANGAGLGRRTHGNEPMGA